MIDEDGHFGEDVASEYDDFPEPMVDGTPVEDAVAVLADLARGGRVLELAIGTGRVAVPLAALGVDLAGIELSRAMLRRLQAKPLGKSISRSPRARRIRPRSSI